MEGINEQSSFTEEQVINITIASGYDGAEFKTSTWQQRGCLKPNRTLEALISKLKTIYNHVEVIGSGKKRKYILKDKKETQTKRKFNYKGSVTTPEDEIMTEYIFNHLLAFKGEFTKSYKGWAKILGFIDTDSLSIEDMIKRIKTLHFGFPRLYNPKEVVSIFIQTINTRNKDVIEKSFKRLENDNRIKVSEVYNIKYVNGKYETITEQDYNKFIAHITEMLKSNNITYYSYSQALSSIHKSNKMKEIINQVNEYLINHFGIEYFFKSFKVIALERTIKKEVTTAEFKEAYFQRLIKLSQERQEKKSYNDSISFWRKFYLINTLTLLKYINATELDELIHEQDSLYLEKLNEFELDITIHNLDMNIQTENIRHSFGNN